MVVDDSNAVYPLTIDPLLTTAVWSWESGESTAFAGDMLAGGDFNGDGFDDLVVGMPQYDGAVANVGGVCVFYGSYVGPGDEPELCWYADRLALLGQGLAALDLDQDGFDDLVVGAPYFANPTLSEGAVYLHRGSSSGLSEIPDWTHESGVVRLLEGERVAAIGDVNADGFPDFGVFLYATMAGVLFDGLEPAAEVYPAGVDRWPLPAAVMEKGIQLCDQALALSARDGWPRRQMALVETMQLDVLLCEGGAPAEAVQRVLELGADADPGLQAVTLPVRVQYFWRVGRIDDAIETYEQAQFREAEPQWRILGAAEMTRWVLADCWAQRGEREKAREYLDTSLPGFEPIERARDLMGALVAIHLGEKDAIEIASQQLARHSSAVGTSQLVRRAALALAQCVANSQLT